MKIPNYFGVGGGIDDEYLKKAFFSHEWCFSVRIIQELFVERDFRAKIVFYVFAGLKFLFVAKLADRAGGTVGKLSF